MTQAASDSRPVWRLLRDGCVVVTSILIAFSLDAWWGEVQTGREVREELQGIDRELAANVTRVEYHIDFMGRIIAASEALLERMNLEASADEVLVSDTLAWFAFGGASPTLDASTGAIDALIASGRLQAVRSPELKGHLSGMEGRIQDAVEEQYVARSLRDQRLNPLLDPVLDRARLRKVATDFYDVRERK